MKARQQRIATWVSLASAALLVLILAAGCTTTSKMDMAQNANAKCPMCHMKTHTAAATGVTYTKHVCPDCHTVRDTGTWDEKADLTQVHVCDHCKAVVEKCPMCAKM
jgi:hypothetical protein